MNDKKRIKKLDLKREQLQRQRAQAKSDAEYAAIDTQLVEVEAELAFALMRSERGRKVRL